MDGTLCVLTLLLGTETMNKDRVLQIVKEEVDNMFKKAEEDHSKYTEKLEELRKKIFKKDELRKENLGNKIPKTEKRMQLSVVSEIVDIPVNELMLYFLNCVKNKNERSLVEYRLGHVYFYNV